MKTAIVLFSRSLIPAAQRTESSLGGLNANYPISINTSGVLTRIRPPFVVSSPAPPPRRRGRKMSSASQRWRSNLSLSRAPMQPEAVVYIAIVKVISVARLPAGGAPRRIRNSQPRFSAPDAVSHGDRVAMFRTDIAPLSWDTLVYSYCFSHLFRLFTKHLGKIGDQITQFAASEFYSINKYHA